MRLMYALLLLSLHSYSWSWGAPGPIEGVVSTLPCGKVDCNARARQHKQEGPSSQEEPNEEFESGRSSETVGKIIGAHRRHEVSTVTNFPWQSIGKIVTRHKNGTYKGHGTGFLVSANTIVTAAHVVRRNRLYYFFPALNSTNMENGYQHVHKYIRKEAAPTDWGYDLAILVLNDSISGVTPFGPSYRASRCNTLTGPVGTAGYPGDLPQSPPELRGHLMYRVDNCETVEQSKNCQGASGIQLHNCDADHRQAGSPMWTFRRYPAPSYSIIGVHVGSVGVYPWNQLKLFTEDDLAWINTLTGAPASTQVES